MSLKNIKKGDTVIVKGFTGIKLGVFEVAKATEKSITVEKKDGSLMIFSKKKSMRYKQIQTLKNVRKLV